MKGKNVPLYVDNAPFRRVLSRCRVAVFFGLRLTLKAIVFRPQVVSNVRQFIVPGAGVATFGYTVTNLEAVTKVE